jgi:hypothetical protein
VARSHGKDLPLEIIDASVQDIKLRGLRNFSILLLELINDGLSGGWQCGWRL